MMYEYRYSEDQKAKIKKRKELDLEMKKSYQDILKNLEGLEGPVVGRLRESIMKQILDLGNQSLYIPQEAIEEVIADSIERLKKSSWDLNTDKC